MRHIPGVLSRLWTDLMHSGLTPTRHDVSRRVFIVNVYSLLAILSLSLFGTLHVLFESPLLGYLELTGAGVFAMNMWGLRIVRNVSLARTLLLATILVLLAVMLLTGGTEGTGIFWLFVFPVSTFFLTDKKQGWMWMIGLFGMVLLLAGLARVSWLDLYYPFTTLRQLLVTLLVVTLGIYAYEQSREKLLATTQKSQRNLREEKIKAEAVIDTIDEAVVVVDDTCRVLFMNRPAEIMLGWSFKDLNGQSFIDAVPMLDKAGSQVPLEKRPILDMLRHARDIKNMPVIYKRKDGDTFPATITGTPIVVEGQHQGGIVMIRDITEGGALERSKSEFVSLASHQLRTPISAINWLSEMLLNGDAGSLSPEQHKYVKQLHDSNQRSIAIVDAMLTMSALEIGKFRTHPQPTDVGALVHEVIEKQLALLQVERKHLHITEDIDKALGLLPLDPAVLRAVLQNLISNAFKYTPAQGLIRIRAQRSNEKPTPTSSGSLLLQVSDSGYGIPKYQQAKVFTKLFRADNIKKKDTDGTGLGLAIAKAMVEYTGGRMWFDSIENKGSTFSVLLPLEEAKEGV